MSTIQRHEATNLAASLKEQLASIDTQEEKKKETIKLGWVIGVFAPCLINIWGVILFLRLPWATAQAGAVQMTLVVLLATAVTFLTAISLSATATNGQVGAGGAYFLISRNLGPAHGGAIGVLYGFAAAVSVSLYAIGFAETLTGMWGWDNNPFGEWALRVIAFLLLTVVFGICLNGIGFLAKLQLAFFSAQLLGMGVIAVGALVSGFASSSGEMVIGPKYTGDESFFSIFAVFFPAATGIMAGANASGNLSNPSSSIPKGTLAAIILSSTVYIILIWIFALTSTRDELGAETLVVSELALWSPLVYVAIFASTTSSTFASMMGAPRVLMAVAADKLIPMFNPLGVVRGSDGEPIRAYILVYIIATGCIGIGNLNTIASGITQLFLISYGFVNYACFASSIVNSPGWRPGFEAYHYSLSALGSLLCLAVMILIDYITAAIAIFVCAGLFAAITYRDPDVNWGSVNQARIKKSALSSALRLQATPEHVKTWSPQILLLTGSWSERLSLIRMAEILAAQSLLILGNVLRDASLQDVAVRQREAAAWIVEHELHAFAAVTSARSLRDGVRSLLMSAGLGSAFRPNVFMMGFRHHWRLDGERSNGYVNIIRDAIDAGVSVVLARNSAFYNFTAPSPDTQTLDVYWLEDDGGLTALLPLLMRRSPLFSKTKLRMFSTVEAGNDVDDTQALYTLLTKLRIKVGALEVLTTLCGEPTPESWAWFESLGVLTLERASSVLASRGCGEEGMTPKRLLGYWRATTRHFLRLGEILAERSGSAAAIFVPLRIPGGNDDGVMYMAWLEAMTRGVVRPVFFIRSTNEDVMTVDA